MLQKYKKMIRPLVIALPLLSMLTCIERNNPWDPINGCPEEYKADIRNSQSAEINLHIDNVVRLIQKIDSAQSGVVSYSQMIRDVVIKNDSLRNETARVNNFNDSVERTNALADCNTLALKKFFPLLDTISIAIASGLNETRKQFLTDSLAVISSIASGNERCLPAGIYSHAQIDSIEQPLGTFGPKADQLMNSYHMDSLSYADSNAHIRDLNLICLSRNQAVFAYNDSVAIVKSYCGINPITADSFILKIPAVKPGDTLYLSADVFSMHFTLENKGDSTKPIVFIGSPFMKTIFDSADVFISNCQNVQFKNIIFQNSKKNSGIKVQNKSSTIYFDNCIFRNNIFCGIECADGSVQLRDCLIYNNRHSGIRISGDGSFGLSLTMDNVIVTHNDSDGVNIGSATVKMDHVTISDNLLNGVRLVDFDKQAIIKNTIFSFNGRSGLYRQQSIRDGMGTFLPPECDFFGNGEKDIAADSVYLNFNVGYKTEDPGFIDRAQNNYRISPSSKLYGSETGYQYKSK
jgi:hypothetical protein